MKKSKYFAIPTTVDGIKFASKKEARRYGELRLLDRAGVIMKLECHPKYNLTIAGEPMMSPSNRQIRYEGDFRYEERVDADSDDWEIVIEDCKGYLPKANPVYRLFSLKRAVIKAMTGIDIRIT
jgi:hypothetical protein